MQDIIRGGSCEIKPLPIDYFLGFVSKATGWEKEELLRSKDIGDLETKLKVKALKPIQSNSAKRGKSMNPLYRFVSDKERKMTKAYVDRVLE